jgi:hypothetical protein
MAGFIKFLLFILFFPLSLLFLLSREKKPPHRRSHQ